jgi:hypothetical protein
MTSVWKESVCSPSLVSLVRFQPAWLSFACPTLYQSQDDHDDHDDHGDHEGHTHTDTVTMTMTTTVAPWVALRRTRTGMTNWTVGVLQYIVGWKDEGIGQATRGGPFSNMICKLWRTFVWESQATLTEIGQSLRVEFSQHWCPRTGGIQVVVLPGSIYMVLHRQSLTEVNGCCFELSPFRASDLPGEEIWRNSHHMTSLLCSSGSTGSSC